MRPRDLPALTIVRYFAALLVALLHYAVFGLRDAPAWLQNIVTSGYMGVPFFFVLSGFILVYVSHGTPMDRTRFWIRRVARIYPVYLLASILYGVTVMGLRGWNLPALEYSAVYGSLSASLVQSWFPAIASKWNAPGWSLSCEALFYLLFPLLFVRLVAARTAILWGVLVASAICCAVRVAVFPTLESVLLLRGTPFQDTLGSYLAQFPPLAIPLFSLGMATGCLYLRAVTVSSHLALPLAGSILALMAVDTETTFLLLRRDTWIIMLFPLLILSLAGLQPNDGPFKSVGVLLGQASYSMYILQFPLWTLLWFCIEGADGREQKSLPIALAFIAGLTAISCIIHLYFERPAEDRVKRWLLRDPSKVKISFPWGRARAS